MHLFPQMNPQNKCIKSLVTRFLVRTAKQLR